MPTSSQSLILKTTNNGILPPLFHRQYWRPEWSTQLPWQRPVIGGNKLYKVSNRREQVYTLRRAESAPMLRLDFSTLPELLQIQGIRGSISYDDRTNSVRWNIANDEPLQAIRSRNFSIDLARLRRTSNSNILYKDNIRRGSNLNRLSYIPEIERRLAFNDHKQFKTPFMNFVKEDGIESLQESEDHSFFRLVKAVNENSEKHGANGACSKFRLVKSLKSEPGSFRLVPNSYENIGDFRMFSSDDVVEYDFRLLRSENDLESFELIRVDEYKTNEFITVEMNSNNEFQATESKVFNPVTGAVKIQPLKFKGTWKTIDSTTNHQSLKQIPIDANYPYISTENRYLFLKEGLVEGRTLMPNTQHHLLPDITTRYDPGHANALGLSAYNTPAAKVSISDTKMDSLDNNMDEFRSKYMESYHEESPEVYNRLVNLGFRRAKYDADRKLQTEINTVSGNGTKQPSEWKNHDFDQWSRKSDANMPNNGTTSPDSLARLNAVGELHSGDSHTKDLKKQSLIDEIRLKTNYKMWKKKKITNLRMRKELPPDDPYAVCITLRDNAISHERLKHIIEKETKCQLISLQFDPVSVHAHESDAKSQWILRFPDKTICDVLITTGINIDGVKHTVRSFNAVMKEEHEAYKFYLIMRQIKEQKMQSSYGGQKPKSKPHKKVKTTQTQTGTRLGRSHMSHIKT